MVVHQLQTYVEKISEGVYSANLRELIKEELACSESEPTIVLDSSSLNYIPNLDNYLEYGGRPKFAKLRIERLVKNIVSCGVNLIVIRRGSDFETLISWFHKHLYNCTQILRQSRTDGEVLPNHLFFPSVQNSLAFISNKNYEVFTSIEDVHREVAEIAVKQNILAVIGQDSEYIIYERIKHFILIKSLEIDTLDCAVYDRNKLVKHLDLKLYHLPLFATLCGNCSVPYELLYEFHAKLGKTYNDRFLGIASIIKHASDDPYKHVKEVVELINSSDVNGDLILKSLDMYLNFEKKSHTDSEFKVFLDDKKRNNKIRVTVYRILMAKEIRNSDVTGVLGDVSAFVLLRPLRQRVYGILLHEEDYPIVEEYCMEEILCKKNKKLVPTCAPALRPKCEHPGLMQLWSEETPSSVKWELFCSGFGGSLSQTTIRSIPVKLLIPVLALHYLDFQVPLLYKKKIFKNQCEVEAFLVSVLLVSRNLEEKLLESWVREDPDRNLLYLIKCFTETCFVLCMLNEACGLVVSNENSDFNDFSDWLLLHCVYKRMREGAKWEEFFDGNFVLEMIFSTLMKFIKGHNNE